MFLGDYYCVSLTSRRPQLRIALHVAGHTYRPENVFWTCLFLVQVLCEHVEQATTSATCSEALEDYLSWGGIPKWEDATTAAQQES